MSKGKAVWTIRSITVDYTPTVRLGDRMDVVGGGYQGEYVVTGIIHERDDDLDDRTTLELVLVDASVYGYRLAFLPLPLDGEPPAARPNYLP